jgi:probable F420-dependent oxidoreductase
MSIRVSAGLPHTLEIPALLAPWERDVGGREIAQVAQVADELGYASVFVPEHFVIPREHEALSGRFYLHAATTQAFVAGATRRIRVNTSIAILPLVNPIVTAKALATLDFLSGGRAGVTFGIGWLEGEFDAMGVPFRERGRRADEYLAAIRTLLEDDEPAFEGRFVSFRDVAFEPKPVQARLPIWLGGDADAALARAARFADGWMPFTTDPDDLPARIDFIKSRPDYDGRPFEVCYSLGSLMLRDGHVPNVDPRAFLPESPHEIVDRLQWLSGQGVTHTSLARLGMPSLEAYLDHLRWAAEEVVPRLR